MQNVGESSKRLSGSGQYYMAHIAYSHRNTGRLSFRLLSALDHQHRMRTKEVSAISYKSIELHTYSVPRSEQRGRQYRTVPQPFHPSETAATKLD